MEHNSHFIESQVHFEGTLSTMDMMGGPYDRVLTTSSVWRVAKEEEGPLVVKGEVGVGGGGGGIGHEV